MALEIITQQTNSTLKSGATGLQLDTDDWTSELATHAR